MKRKVEEALRENEAWFRSMLDNSRDVIYRINVQTGRFEYISPSCEKVVGFSPEELMTQDAETALGLIHSEDLPAMKAAIAQLEETGAVEVEYRQQCKAGDYRWLSNHLSLKRDSAGRPLYRDGNIRDVTERKQVEEVLSETNKAIVAERQRLYDVLESLPAMVCLLTPDYHVAFTNQAFREMFGESEGRHCYEYCMGKGDGPCEFCESFKVLETGESHRWEAVTLDGSVFNVYVQPLQDVDGSPLVLEMSIDITEYKKMEETLRDSEERYRYLAAQLQEADYRKDEFIGILSHEIRNPLAAIKMSLYLLEHHAILNEKSMMAKDIMNRQVSQLARLLDDLLDVTRLNRNRVVLKKKRFEMAERIQKVLQDYQDFFQEKEVVLETSFALTPVYINADEARLAQITGNLLHNAVKFSPKGGTVKVSLTQEGQFAILRVEDGGAGMTNDVLKNLFTPFIQADKSLHRGEDSGLGLGLVLVKGLTELHGGKVSAHSEGLDKGSVFTIRLPLAAEEAVLSGHEPDQPVPFRRRRILVVEDIRDVADSLKSLLESDGHEVRVSYDGPESIAIAKEFRPEILLCDIGLPSMDGYEVARTFSTEEELKDVFLVSITGYARPKDLERAQEAGFQIHIAKPVDLNKLRQALSEVR